MNDRIYRLADELILANQSMMALMELPISILTESKEVVDFERVRQLYFELNDKDNKTDNEKAILRYCSQWLLCKNRISSYKDLKLKRLSKITKKR